MTILYRKIISYCVITFAYFPTLTLNDPPTVPPNKARDMSCDRTLALPRAAHFMLPFRLECLEGIFFDLDKHILQLKTHWIKHFYNVIQKIRRRKTGGWPAGS